MNTAIIGTAGIPANYGGFETLVEYLSIELGGKNRITVFCSRIAYKKKIKSYNGVKLRYINLNANGIQSILYDIISLFLAARVAETILILGVSGAIALPLFKLLYPQKKLVVNIDGLEHKRQKWGKMATWFLKYSEKLAIKYGDEIIADNKGIQVYVKEEYNYDCNLIAYGGNHVKKLNITKQVANRYNIPQKYAFKVCRIEPENNIHIIVEAFSNLTLPLVLIGNWNNSQYGKKLFEKYKGHQNLILLNPIYNQDVLNQIRSNCFIYIHGHSAGGTNPSLVEAMSLGLPILAFDVNYNRETTFNKALYFSDINAIKEALHNNDNFTLKNIGEHMSRLANEHYTWELISKKYNRLF